LDEQQTGLRSGSICHTAAPGYGGPEHRADADAAGQEDAMSERGAHGDRPTPQPAVRRYGAALVMAIAAILVAATSSAIALEPQDAQGEELDVVAVGERWMEAYNDADVDAILELYSPDIVFVDASSLVVEGHDGVRGILDLYRGAGFHTIAIEPLRVHVLGDHASALGRYTLTHESGQETKRGYYHIAFVRRDGAWQQVLATNTAIEEPAEARAAARAARLAVAEEPEEER
jgi:uncharacterized protein (TIGR02246 family)